MSEPKKPVRHLTADQENICFRKGTELPFSGKYYDFWETGIYACVVCDTPLFISDTKYDSGSGWPSFFQPIDSKSIREESDTSLGERPRTEVLCAKCGSHLGHVFSDGPAPTGLRYCINSLALDFKKS